jgi:hypothetical protein
LFSEQNIVGQNCKVKFTSNSIQIHQIFIKYMSKNCFWKKIKTKFHLLQFWPEGPSRARGLLNLYALHNTAFARPSCRFGPQPAQHATLFRAQAATWAWAGELARSRTPPGPHLSPIVCGRLS